MVLKSFYYTSNEMKMFKMELLLLYVSFGTLMVVQVTSFVVIIILCLLILTKFNQTLVVRS